MPFVPVVDVQQGLSEPTGKASVSSSLRLLAVLALLMPTGVLTGVAEHCLRYYSDSEWLSVAELQEEYRATWHPNARLYLSASQLLRSVVLVDD